MKINGNEYEVAIQDVNGQNVEVEVNGKAYTVELDQPELPPLLLPLHPSRMKCMLRVLPSRRSQAPSSASTLPLASRSRPVMWLLSSKP